MVFTAKPGEQVIFQHFGNKLDDLSGFQHKEFKKQPDTQHQLAPQIFPAYGGRHYQAPALKMTHADGVLTTDLVYASMRQTSLDENRTETVIFLKDSIYPVHVEVHFIAYRKENIISQFTEIYHNEKKDIQVEQIASSFVPLHAQAYYLTHFYGTWAHEMQQEEEMLTHGVKTIETRRGIQTTKAEHPSFILSINAPAQENSGDVYAGTLAWSGNYELSFEVDETGRLNIISGMHPFAATRTLSARDKLRTPEMLLAYSPNGKGEITRNFHNWGRKYGMMHADKLRPIVLNSWEGAYFNFTEQTITDMIDTAADFGVELFVLDDGWFGSKYPRNADNAGLGDWHVNTDKLPRGVGYLADYAASKGLQFGIWIEPEMVNPNSELAKKYPEWIVKSGQRDILPMRNQWVLDLTNPQVQDFIVETFDRILAMSPHINYVKWDANRSIDNVGSDYLPADKQSHFWHDYVTGLYHVYERIRAKHPDVQIQLCSAGGGRLDYGALKYHNEVWTSDNTNALDRIFIQHGANTFFPAMATGAHVSTSPNHQTGMMLPLKFRFDVAMSGRLGLELQPKDIKGDEIGFAKAAISCYKQIRPIIQWGDLYRLLSPYGPNGWASHMYVSQDKQQAVLFAYSLKYHGRTEYFETKLAGLDSTKQYKVTEINKQHEWSVFDGNEEVFSGDYLMNVGLMLHIGSAFESAVFLLEEQ